MKVHVVTLIEIAIIALLILMIFHVNQPSSHPTGPPPPTVGR